MTVYIRACHSCALRDLVCTRLCNMTECLGAGVPHGQTTEAVVLCLFVVQGIDLKAGGRVRNNHRTAPRSENPYILLLVKVSAASLSVVPLF